MTINIQKCANVTVIGHRNHKNCKPVYCIDTGEIYASTIDAADANEVSKPSMSNALTGKTRTCNGKRFCFVSKMMEHLEEITEANRIRAEKVAAYDAEQAKRIKISDAQANVEKRKANADELRQKLADADALVAEAERELNELTNN
jgi:hypothetical protein